jgi:copper transport protein
MTQGTAVIRRRLLAVIVALAGLAAMPAAAAAHARLEGSTPADGARLANPPASVTFRFSEPVTLAPESVRVFDPQGRDAERGRTFHPGDRQAEAGVGLPFDLGDGTYTATYHLISADSHPVAGGMTFRIGDGRAAGASLATLLRGQTTGPVTGTALSVARAVQFTAIALALGALVFVLLCWTPGLRAVAGAEAGWAAASATFARRTSTLLRVAALAGLVSSVAALALLAAQLEGRSAWAAARPDALGDLLGTRFGLAWALGAGLWLVVGIAVVARPAPMPVLRPVSVGAAGLALDRVAPRLGLLLVPLSALALLPALSGHAAEQSPVALLLPANVVHVVAVSAWLGGIAMLVLAVRAAARELVAADAIGLLGAVLSRFSGLAGVAVAVLFLGGAIQAVAEVGRLGALVDTAFGRAVLIKLVAFGAIVALGWVNRRRLLSPLMRVDAGADRAGRLLRRTVQGELVIGVAVMAVTGALAGYAPSTAATTAAAPPPPPTPDASASAGFDTEVFLGPTHVKMRVHPGRVGAVDVALSVFNHALQPFRGTKEVQVSAALPGKGIAPIPFRVRRAGPTRFAAAGTLGVPGTWRFTVTLRVSAFDEYSSHVLVPIR